MHINARHLGQKLTRFAIAFGTSAHTQLQGQWNVNNSVNFQQFKDELRALVFLCKRWATVWHYQLWTFQGRDTIN